MRIAAADDLHVSPFREDGKTRGTPTWIWSVVIDGELYARAYNGQNSRWFKAAREQRAGRITIAGVTEDVAFEAISDAALNERVDAAYRAKYSKSQYLAPIIGAHGRAATVKIAPKNRS